MRRPHDHRVCLARAAGLLGIAGLVGACATFRPPDPQVLAAAQAATSYDAEIRASLKGPGGRGRVSALAAFRRPDGLRIEIPGPAGPRLVLVAREGRITAVLPSEKAVFVGPADAGTVDAVLGVALTPAEIMDLLVGRITSPAIVSARVGWGPTGPDEIEARLDDGTRLRLSVRGIALERELGAGAFRPPRHDGYRSIDAGEVADLLARP